MAHTAKRVVIKCCCVESCDNFKGSKDGVRMFRFPKDRSVSEKWNRALGFAAEKILNGNVCILHFEDDCFINKKNAQLKSNAVPTIFKTKQTDDDQCTLDVDFSEIPTSTESSTDVADITAPAIASQNDQNLPILNSSSSNSITHIHTSSSIDTIMDEPIWCLECRKKDEVIEKKDIEIKILRKKLLAAQKKNWHLESVKRKLDVSLLDLKNQSVINEDGLRILEVLKNDDLFRILHHGIERGEKYPEKVRHFCFGLLYRSPSGYDYVRKQFNNHLPHRKTLQAWFSNSDICSEPGIQDGQIEKLKKIAADYRTKYNRQLLCCLIFDEIHLRQQICWSFQELKYIGYSNFGGKVEDPENPGKSAVNIAKQAIVFILNGIDVNLEIPVAYFFIGEFKANDRSKLLKEVIATVSRCDIKISNLTFDGLAGNVTACESLGANLNVKHKDFRPYIDNPITKEKVHIILDPCHMEKLVRNRWSACKVFYDRSGNKIEWRYIEELYKYSNENDFRTHKISKKHIEWQRNSMNVRLAVETFSESTARSIQFLLEQNILEFQGAQPTIDFILRMDKLFNIFNSKNSNHENIFKRALSPTNNRIIFDFCLNSIKFLKHLKVEETFYKKDKKDKKGSEEENEEEKSEEKKGKKAKKDRVISHTAILPILNTRHKCGFRGFIICMKSLIAMYKEYVENHLLEEIPTYFLLQDAIEMMFGRIRACGGFNNNPNVLQFKGAFRKIQANMKLDISEKSNCRMFDMNLPDSLFYSDIYFVSSKRAKIAMNQHAYNSQKDQILQLVENDNYEPVEMAEEIETANSTHHLLDGTAFFMNAYIASAIERKIMECRSFHCSGCISVFEENDKLHSIDSNLLSHKPCNSTVNICIHTEKFFKLYNIQLSQPKFDFKVLFCLIFRSMDFATLFPKSAFACDSSHKYQFIKCIVGQYIATRAKHISKQFTLDRQDKIVRQQYTHLVNSMGQ